MERSLSMQFIQMRAEAEVKAARGDEVGVEHLFLGLLKLAELRADDVFNVPDFIAKTINADIDEVKARFSASKIDTTRTRALLRYMASAGTTTGKSLVDKILHLAAEKARKRHEKVIWAQDLLSAIMEQPCDMILQVCPVQRDGQIVDAQETGDVPDAANEMSRDFLPELTKRIRKMRAQLLSTVFGQDHVVHAFAEGMFAAEVLAASDEKRRRPRAIFVFAGPPGVGKTFLAEQAAEALEMPYKRFDMSSYADHQSYQGLVGFEKSYHGAKPGTLTEFVKEHPHSILLFDEIEKAHLNTINLFLQILDAGRLHDRYLDEDVAFRDTIIIFTSNACKTLYDGEARENAAGVPRITILNALETEQNPLTGQPFFPATITSRMATGWPLLFNHLQAHHLEKISANELNRFCALFEKQYGIQVRFDKLIPTALMLQEGSRTEARTLRAQTELFFKNEVFKVCRLWGENRFAQALADIQRIRFTVDVERMAADIRPLFESGEKPEILLYGSVHFAARCRRELPGYVIHQAQSIQHAMDVLGEKDVRLALIDVAERSADRALPGKSFGSGSENSWRIQDAEDAFDYAPMAAGAIRDGTRLFRSIRERMPELPVYLLETEDFVIDPELEMSFLRAGARGKLVQPTADFSVFEDMLASICRELYIQHVATRMGTERKALYFDTAPKLSHDKTEVNIRVRDFSIKRAIAADDLDSVLDDVEKPDTRFTDVIGAKDAKDELQFFIDYLKNPRRFTAQGVKPPKGVLLYGPPGTGKTMLARAMAGESDVTFIPCVATDFVTKWQGSGPESVRTLFRRARRYAPAIVFIDEIDAIGRKRGGIHSGHGEEMALNALLAELDGFSVDPKRPVFVLAATNFDVEEGKGGPGVLDAALLRRFDCRILVDLPDAAEREQFITHALAKLHAHQVSSGMVKRLAARSTGMSPANLSSVMETANRLALKARTVLTDALLDEAFEVTRHGEKKDWGYEYLERVARHESGHALLSCLAGEKPAYLTIVARGDHGGYMEHQSSEQEPLRTKTALENRIRVCLGGRAAEVLYYGSTGGASTGASGDLQQASKIAYNMIYRYGMDADVGLCALEDVAPTPEEVRRRINALLNDQFRQALTQLTAHRDAIDRLVKALMEKNKLTEDEITAIIDGNR